jgi:hypothetical protein
MPEPVWRSNLDLLRRGDSLAWAEVADDCFQVVFIPLLHHARTMNSKYRGALPDDEVRDLALTLTTEAFHQAMTRILEYDPTRSELPTWVVWLGKAKANGVIGPILRQARARALEYNLDDSSNPRIKAMIDAASRRSSRSPEDEVVQQVDRLHLVQQVSSVLARMKPDHAWALLEVWARRSDGVPYPVTGAAEAMGKSPEAMDSLLRRAERRFRKLWASTLGDE